MSAPTVFNILPNSGSTAGGTLVTITGSNFISGNTIVSFGGVTATSISITNSGRLTCTTPSNSAGAKNVVVTTSNGTATKANGFTYYGNPTITTISPNAGTIAGGTSVTITGSNFFGSTLVSFGGVAATSINITSSTRLTCITPSNSLGATDVVVTTSIGTATSTNGFTYSTNPTITTISPNLGSTAGGTLVTITGTNFIFGSTLVSFGGVTATSISVIDSTQLTCVTPTSTSGAKNVLVITPIGGVSSINGFTYYGTPTITSISPNYGTISGSTTVTINGTNFISDATTVSFRGAAATSISVINSTQLTCSTPSNSVGATDVVVTTSFGTTTSTSGFTYYETPTITTISPNSGTIAGGTLVVIRGTNFISGDTIVSFGGAAATSITVTSLTRLTCNTPSNSVGATNVVVSTSTGTATSTNGFTYNLIPTITTISPNFGTIDGGTTVTITGTNFVSGGDTSVTFGGIDATDVVVTDSTQLTCSTPINSSGATDVAVTTSNGTGTSTNGFTYYGPPTIITISPSSGSTEGGTSVTITGSEYIHDNTSVTFNGVDATNVVVNDSTELTCDTPPNNIAGLVSVTITTTTVGSTTADAGFEYTAVCFHEDTLILTSKGYLPIKNLKKGDLVKTFKNGFKPIHIIGYSKIYNSGDNKRIVNRLYQYSKDTFDKLFNDLLLTGGHSILVDEYTNENQKEKNEKVFGKSKNYVIDEKICLTSYVNENAIPYEKIGTFAIYHLALENEDETGNYGIYANGLLVEAIDINCIKKYSGMTFIE